MIPAFLRITPNVQASSFADVETGGVGFITHFRAAAVTNGGWTEPSSDLFRSPPDDDGYFMDVLLTRISSTSLEIRLRDHLGRTIYTRRIHISGTVAGVVIVSEKHFSIINQDGNEEAHGAMVDFSPMPHGANGAHVWGAGRRNSSGTDDNGWNQSAQATSFLLDNVTIQARTRFIVGLPGGVSNVVHGTGLMADGAVGVVPCVTSGHSGDSSNIGQGRLFGFIFGQKNAFTVGSKPTLPVDDSTDGVFRVLYPNILHNTPEVRMLSFMGLS
jgi:hypothetical protein